MLRAEIFWQYHHNNKKQVIFPSIFRLIGLLCQKVSAFIDVIFVCSISSFIVSAAWPKTKTFNLLKRNIKSKLVITLIKHNEKCLQKIYVITLVKILYLHIPTLFCVVILFIRLYFPLYTQSPEHGFFFSYRIFNYFYNYETSLSTNLEYFVASIFVVSHEPHSGEDLEFLFALRRLRNLVRIIDRKHIKLQCSSNSFSNYFCYKNYISIVFLAVVNPHCNFMVADKLYWIYWWEIYSTSKIITRHRHPYCSRFHWW